MLLFGGTRCRGCLAGMPPSFLNSREDALLVWTAVILAYVVFKDPRTILGSFAHVLRALVAPKLLMLFGFTAIYSAALVWAAFRLGVWDTAALKSTIYWFLGTGVVLAGAAVVSGRASLSREVVRRVVAITVIMEFVANAYAFPLAAESDADYHCSCL